ncbi:MAG: cell wall metabolism sensor histidine kinase WalK [Oscillospiraceae bacterium]|jgi:signal transduction histidine kinase|nr:cell wall metabolism sensor histidine kinase WalK [Oscillospiraceae bacterium]
MNKSLYTKLVLIMLLLILSLMAVAGAFLMNGIRSFYLDDFYQKMKTVFENPEFANDLYSAASDTAGDTSPEAKLAERLRTYSGQLGIDSGSRNYYILSGQTGAVLTGSDTETDSVAMTPNILTAIGGEAGYINDHSAEYMDVALPVDGGAKGYIIYIKDNKSAVYDLSSALIGILSRALLIGLIISVFLSMLLAKAMVTPLQNLTKAAESVSAGDFSPKLESDAKDEIGVLTRTFSSMARQLETTLDHLKRSETMRREFVANVSHELRTPITSIRSYAETLQDAESLPAETEKEFLGVIVNESDRMTNIVQDLLMLSRFDAGSMEFSFARFSFEKALRDVYSAMLLEAKKHDHRFTLELKTPLPELVGDRARIEQVLINMISNAIKYTRDGGTIALSAGQAGDAVWVSVRDNGIGIPKEDLPKVFDRFYRVDKARSRESGGTGLGLSIAREIIARHNGKITLNSRPGKGTVITATLPVEGPQNA